MDNIEIAHNVLKSWSVANVTSSECNGGMGTGGFLSEGDEYIQQISESVTVSLHGQELNPESYAICKADMLIKGQEVSNIKLGNTLSDDQLATNKFDLMLSNPPFGVEWKKVQKQVTDEHKHRGCSGIVNLAT